MNNNELNLLKMQNKAVSLCRNFLLDNNFNYFKTEEILQKMGKLEYSPFTYIGKIYELKTLDEVVQWHGKFLDALCEAAKEETKFEKEKIDELKEEKNKEEESFKNSVNEQSKNETPTTKDVDKLNKEKEEWQKRESEKKEEKTDPYLPKEGDSFDEKTKKKYIQGTERELKKNNISDQILNQRLGVDDWRDEMSKSVDWSSAQDFWFGIKGAIEKISREIVCDNCKETKSPIIDYIALDGKNKKKKFCSWECQNSWEDYGKKNDSTTNSKRNLGISDISEFFAWMKKMGVIEIKFNFSSNCVEIKCGNGKKLNINNSGLSVQTQRELTRELKSTRQPITFSQVNDELSRKNNKNNNKNATLSLVGFILIFGVVIAIIVAMITYKNKKKDNRY